MTSVLLLEDDATLREVLQLALEDDGHQVLSLDCLGQLLDTALAWHGDAVALVDGWGSSHAELPQDDRLVIQSVAACVPTIVMSGRAWIDRVSATELGVVALVRKPADLEELLTLVGGVHPLAAAAH